MYDEDALKVWCNKTFGDSVGVQVYEYYTAHMPPIDPAFPDDAHHMWYTTRNRCL